MHKKTNDYDRIFKISEEYNQNFFKQRSLKV